MSSEKYCLSFFDFDGTLIKGDSFSMFIRFVCGNFKYFFGAFVLSPVLISFILRLVSNDKAKEIVFGFFFKGMDESSFVDYCKKFVHVLKKNENKFVVKKMLEENNAIILTASPRLWVQPWAAEYNIEVEGTELEFRNNRLTGKFASRNCRADEKVDRMKKIICDDRSNFLIKAYGDSISDEPMLKYADLGYWVKNERIIKYEK